MSKDGEVVFEDSENWSSSKENTRQHILLEQYRSCLKEGSKLQSGPMGWIQREIFINSVTMLETSLIDEILNTKEYKNIKLNIEENEAKIKIKEQEYSELYKRLKDNGQQINEQLLKENFEKEIVNLNKDKLKILTILLNQMNWLGEISIYDGMT